MNSLTDKRHGSGEASNWGLALAGVMLGALITLVVFAPAVWVQSVVNSLSEERVRLTDSRGTVWQGSAQLGFTGGAGSLDAAQLPGRFEWRMGAGLSGLHLALTMPCCARNPLQLQITPGWNTWKLSVAAHQSHWPAALLAGLGTPWNTLAPEGELSVTSQGFVVQGALNRWNLTGSLQVDAIELSSRLSTLRPLGSYRLAITGGAQPRLELSTLRGSLQLNGQGEWIGEKLRFTGEARAQSPHEPELQNLLNIIGRRDGARSVINLG